MGKKKEYEEINKKEGSVKLEEEQENCEENEEMIEEKNNEKNQEENKEEKNEEKNEENNAKEEEEWWNKDWSTFIEPSDSEEEENGVLKTSEKKDQQNILEDVEIDRKESEEVEEDQIDYADPQWKLVENEFFLQDKKEKLKEVTKKGKTMKI